MIIRIFRVRIYPEFREEFEGQFQKVSVQAVDGRDGFLSASIGKPSEWAPDEYVMISKWRDQKAIMDFSGETWNQPHIPQGMGKFMAECWLHHYVGF